VLKRHEISSMDALDHHEVRRGPLVWIVTLVVRYLSTSILQLQLWHLHWLVSVQSVSELHSREPYVLQFLSHTDAGPIVKTHKFLDDVNLNIPMQLYQLHYYMYPGLKIVVGSILKILLKLFLLKTSRCV
jgi:hypothetical protein